MKKYLTLEILIDEEIEDSKQCADAVINEALGHYYCCDGTVDIKIIDEE